MRTSLWFLIAIALLAAACGKKSAAADEFAAAMSDVSDASRAFTAAFPALDADIERLRVAEPAKAAARVEASVLPLVDRIVAAMDRAGTTGASYLAVADGEDPDALAKIRANLDATLRRRAGFAGLRDVYAEEARLLRAGPLAQADVERLGRRMVELGTAISQ
jgi:hypothetical protein